MAYFILWLIAVALVLAFLKGAHVGEDNEFDS